MERKHILLVDDDPDDQLLFREALEYADEGADFSIASNGIEALAALEDENVPDIVFLDLNMPIMNGEECLKAIRGNTSWQKLPVVIYSTSVAPEHEKKLLRSGATAVLKKPHDFIALCNMIGSFILKLNNKS